MPKQEKKAGSESQYALACFVLDGSLNIAREDTLASLKGKTAF
jgi:hypothetical protein